MVTAKHRRERAAEPEDVPARGRAEREHVGAGRETGESEGDSEFLGAQPIAPVELALQDRDGGVASAEDGDAHAEEETCDVGECEDGASKPL